MMANAIGPQNTVGAIRDEAEHGRDRGEHDRLEAMAPSTIASHTSRPCARSASTC